MNRNLRYATVMLLAGGLAVGGVLSAQAQGSGPLVIRPKAADPNQLISFSFSQADIDDVLRFLADASGKTIYKDSSVSTQITIRNQSRIKVSEAIALVQNLLANRGFALFETDDSIYVMSKEQAKGAEVPTSIGKDLATIPKGRGIIRHIFPLSNVDAVRMQQELNPIFGVTGTTLIASSETNSLVVVGEANTIRSIAQMINLLDRDLQDEVQVDVIRLKYADATEVARYMTELFRPEPQQGGGNQGGGGGGNPFNPMGGGPGGAGAAGANQRGSLAALRGRVRFAADERSNSLLVYASPANHKLVRTLIDQIDVNLAPRTEYRIVALKYADAQALSDQLNQLAGNATSSQRGNPFSGFFNQNRSGNNQQQEFQYSVVPDVRTNSIIITAPTDAAPTLEDLIKKLDQPSQVESVVRVFQLRNAIASEVATTLRNLFSGTQQGGNLGFGLFGGGGRTQIPPNSPLDLLRQVTIVPNDQTNQLVISGPAQTFPVIESLLDTQTGLDRRLPQVFIEVTIADITLDDLTRYGIEWNAFNGSFQGGTNFGLTSPTADPTGFSYSVLSNNFQATLRALKQQNKVNIVSTPHVLVTDNSPALISIGESIPYAGQSNITNGVVQTTTEFQDVSITLNVTPRISPGSHILMDIDQVVNSLIEFIQVGPNQTAPRTTSRRAGTTVIVQDNQTVVLGGIISRNDTKNVSKVPILGDIPLFGQLFRNTVRDKSRTELVVFITPHIVADNLDADYLREYERQRLSRDPLKSLEGPFKRPLDLKSEDLKKYRDQLQEGRSSIFPGIDNGNTRPQSRPLFPNDPRKDPKDPQLSPTLTVPSITVPVKPRTPEQQQDSKPAGNPPSKDPAAPGEVTKAAAATPPPTERPETPPVKSAAGQ